MSGDERRGEMVTALGAAGAVAFSPVVLGLFDVGADVRPFGIPLLVLAVFAAWAILIALLAVTARRITEPPESSQAAREPSEPSAGKDR